MRMTSLSALLLIILMLSGCAAINHTRMDNLQVRLMKLREQCLQQKLAGVDIDCAQFDTNPYETIRIKE